MTEPVLQWSPDRDKILPAYFAARKAMGPLKKNAKNDHFKNKYADLGAVFDTIEDQLEAQGLLPIQGLTCVFSEGAWAARIDTEIVHVASGQFVRAVTDLPLAKADAQGGGSGFTYGRRYALQAMFGLAPEDDDGNTASQRTNSVATTNGNGKTEKPKVIDAQKRALFNALTAQLPTAEVEAAITTAQQHYNSLPTGRVEDLYEGDEARRAYGLLQQAVRDLTGSTK